MRKTWCTLLAGTLAVALTACTGDDQPSDQDIPVPTGGTPTPTRPQIGSWTPLADLPQARTELSAVVLDGAVYVAGGLAPGPGGDAFYRYDPESDAWRELAPLPEDRHHAPLAAYDGRIYVVAGFANRVSDVFPFGDPTDTLFVYDVAGDSWRLGPPLPVSTGAHAVIGGGPTPSLSYSAATEIWRP
ncbi:MAG: hypothetical protein GEV12_11580 [Micromonosporaceae bacterium]|nr:hypothetical protein [Micromonosporaceae bacterium]